MTRPRFELKKSVRLYTRGKTSVRPVIAKLEVMSRIARKLEDVQRDALLDYLDVAVRQLCRAVRPAPKILQDWMADNEDMLSNVLSDVSTRKNLSISSS
jgi:hypothetical protein